MRCLCCGKEIKDTASAEERETAWHHRCIRAFFGTVTMPVLNLASDELEKIANDTVNHGSTVPGVQKKISLHLSTDQESRLTIVDYPAGYILKPQSQDYRALPEAEDLVMRMAEIAGIRVVPHALLQMEQNGIKVYAYITRRVDRKFSKNRGKFAQIQRYAMEDFCQLNFRLTADKYKGSYEQCARTIRRYSMQPMLDISELFLRLAFCYICGNSDMHLKNFSLIETEPASRQFVFSPAYDLLPVNLILPEDREQTALTLHGKKRNLHRNDFLKYADTIGYPGKAAEKMIDYLVSKDEAFFRLIHESYLPQDMKENMRQLVKTRLEVLRRKKA